VSPAGALSVGTLVVSVKLVLTPVQLLVAVY